MTRVVLDTNVVVSAALGTRRKTPFSAPSLALMLGLNGRVALVVSAELLAEYEGVLLRPKFHFSPRLVRRLLADIRRMAIGVRPQEIPPRVVRDPDDTHVLGCALAGKADYLVTGNTEDFPERYGGVSVLAPAAFIQWAIEEGLLA